MDNLSLTEADKNLGAYIMGVVKGYWEGYDYAREEAGLGSGPDAGTGRDADGDRSPLSEATAADASATPESFLPGGRHLPGTPDPDGSTDAGSDPDPGVEQGEGESKAEWVRQGMLLALRGLAEELNAAGLIEAAVWAERHAAGLEASTLRTIT